MKHSNVGGDQRVETELFNWDTELAELAFVSLDHVAVSLSDLLQLSLDLTNGLVLELFNFLKGAPDHAESLGIDPCSGQYLVSLGILSLKTFLDRLQFLLKNKVAQSCLAVDIINDVMELLKELLLFVFNILVLLVEHFVLPLDLLILFLLFYDPFLFLS